MKFGFLGLILFYIIIIHLIYYNISAGVTNASCLKPFN